MKMKLESEHLLCAKKYCYPNIQMRKLRLRCLLVSYHVASKWQSQNSSQIPTRPCWLGAFLLLLSSSEYPVPRVQKWGWLSLFTPIPSVWMKVWHLYSGKDYEAHHTGAFLERIATQHRVTSYEDWSLYEEELASGIPGWHVTDRNKTITEINRRTLWANQTQLQLTRLVWTWHP